jgi:ABC-type sugar transport system ATPase subunit
MGLVGDNGAGKSTLMKIISGVVAPTAGHLEIEGSPVAFSSPLEASEAGIATVYQDLALAPQRTITENFFLGREIVSANWLGKRLGWLDNAAMERETRARLQQMNVKIKDLNTPCGLLSGGQRQGLVIARAAAWSRRVLLLDEPTSALSVAQHHEVLEIVRRSRDHGLAVMLVSHQMPDIMAVCDRVTVLRLGQVVGQLQREQLDGDTLVAHITGAAAMGAR